MPRKNLFTRSGPALFVLLCAAAGQFFLAQRTSPYTLWVGLLFYGLALWRMGPLALPSPKIRAYPFNQELIFFSLILILAFFLRIFRIDSLPSGMHTDQGLMGISALRIAFEGWRPFYEVFNYHVPEVGLYYQLAAWFRLFGSSYFTFHLFFALFSLAAFPFVYWTFRQLSGPPTALLALFLLAVMRWNLIDSRNGFPTIQVPFYLFGTLAFWVFWLRRRQPWALVIAALFCGVGLYTYQSFKAVPFLMLLLGIRECLSRRPKTWVTGKHLLVFFLLVALVAGPFILYMVHQGSFGNREQSLFIGKEVVAEKSLSPLLKVWTGTALMFNREGDGNPRHNIPGHRMLDDLTGLCLILGLALAWRRRKERDSFYALTGLFVMSLPGLLSTDAAHSNRLLALTPFVAYLAARGLETGLDLARKALPFRRAWALGILLALATAQNAQTYFIEQAGNYDCWKGYGPEQNFIGKTIETLERALPGKTNYFVTPAYFGNHTIAYLGYAAAGRLRGLQIPDDLKPGRWPSDRDAVFFLEEGKSGLFDFLRVLFPGGQTQKLVDKADGHCLVYLYRVPAASLKAFHGWSGGLLGTYINSEDPNAKPIAVRWDPLINFTYKRDFPFQDYPPFRVHWKGRLNIPATGDYRFLGLCFDWAELRIDGKKVTDSSMGPAKVFLRRGAHPLDLDYRKETGDSVALHLIWQKPGDNQWEVIPATAFGKIR